jgi:hypothetical protein
MLYAEQNFQVIQQSIKYFVVLMEKLNLSMPFMVKAFLISARQWDVMKA